MREELEEKIMEMRKMFSEIRQDESLDPAVKRQLANAVQRFDENVKEYYKTMSSEQTKIESRLDNLIDDLRGAL